MGAYPQDSVILKISNKEVGGGAYGGAMALSDDYMPDMTHELGHSYFMQSVTPARGFDAILYEGFGDWSPLFGSRTGYYPDLNLKDSIFSSGGEYRLWATSEMFGNGHLRNPHQTGRALLASIDQFLKQKGQEGGLLPVLKVIAQERRHQTMSMTDFKKLVERETKLDLTELFQFYFVD